jgi:hypothetical protein
MNWKIIETAARQSWIIGTWASVGTTMSVWCSIWFGPPLHPWWDSAVTVAWCIVAIIWSAKAKAA